MHALIDTTEMYLRTVYELEEEGIPPMRARIVERLGLSGPAVSETVARLEREGLMHLRPNRHIELTDEGRRLACSVMRKHRLAELLLTEIIGMPWERVHNEACRWEHVISDDVEQRIDDLLGHPAVCPHGNPVPPHTGARSDDVPAADPSLHTLAAAAAAGPVSATVRRISEQLQVDEAAMRQVRELGLTPLRQVRLSADGELLDASGARAVPAAIADHVFVAIA